MKKSACDFAVDFVIFGEKNAIAAARINKLFFLLGLSKVQTEMCQGMAQGQGRV